MAQDARDYFDGKPLKGSQIALGDYFAVVPLDNAYWCQCDECQKQLAIDEGNIRGEHFNCGTATHYLWTFVNNVAKEVKKTHPDKKIAALSYHVYAYLPKDIQLEDNISVAPCLHPRNYWAPKMKENELAFYKDWIAESKESGRHIFMELPLFPYRKRFDSRFQRISRIQRACRIRSDKDVCPRWCERYFPVWNRGAARFLCDDEIV